MYVRFRERGGGGGLTLQPKIKIEISATSCFMDLLLLFATRLAIFN